MDSKTNLDLVIRCLAIAFLIWAAMTTFAAILFGILVTTITVPLWVQYSLMAVYIGFSPIVSLGLPVLRYTDILRNFK